MADCYPCIPTDPAPPLIFDALLYPNRSLNRAGFVVLMLLFGGLCFIGGVLFSLLGAWPVAGFLGLDILLLYVAFKVSYRSGQMTESLRLTSKDLTVKRQMPGGRTQSWAFQPSWVRVIVEDPDDHNCRVVLQSHGKRLVIGGFLAPDERLDLAGALNDALLDWRRQVASHQIDG